MQVFMQPLEQLGEFDEISSRLVKNRGVLQLSGCVESQKAHMMYGLFEALKKDRKQGCNCLIIAENDLKAKELYEDYRLYNRDVYFYPARDLIFFQADIHGNLLTRERMQVIAALLEKKNITVITSMSGCMDYLLPLDVLGQHTLSFKIGSPLDMEKLKLQLRGMGYERDAQAETPGQFSFQMCIRDRPRLLHSRQDSAKRYCRNQRLWFLGKPVREDYIRSFQPICRRCSHDWCRPYFTG